VSLFTEEKCSATVTANSQVMVFRGQKAFLISIKMY
jgi:hypothetical protein